MDNVIQELVTVLEDKKAKDLVTFDIREKSDMTDFLIICTSNSTTHAKALFQAVDSYVKEHQLKVYSLEGFQEGSWILIDLGFAIIHIMDELLRQYYHLERLWTQVRTIAHA